MKVKLILFLFLSGLFTNLLAASLDSPAPPDDPNSAMYTLQSLCERLSTGAAGTKRESGFVGPPSGPLDAVGCSLNDAMAAAPPEDNVNGAKPEEVLEGKTFWGLRTDGSWGLQTGTATFSDTDFPIPLAKTGPVSSFRTGDDGFHKKGAWIPPAERFTDNDNGTVTDNLTGLIWTQNANCPGQNKNWDDAIDYANDLGDGICDLTDGSSAGDWRLPNRVELLSLVDLSQYDPALPSGYENVFSGVKNGYWSSTVYVNDTIRAWGVYFINGHTYYDYKTVTYPVWPVRSLIPVVDWG